MRMVDAFERDDMELAVDLLIERLDARDAPDDPDGPDFRARGDGHPGDPTDAEPGGDEHDCSWPEWQSRGRHKLTLGGYEMRSRSALDGETEDDEAYGDERDASFPEWDGRGGGEVWLAHDAQSALGMEDAENDDSDRCSAGDDMVRAGPVGSITGWREPRPGDAGYEPGCEDDDEPSRSPPFMDRAELANDADEYAHAIRPWVATFA